MIYYEHAGIVVRDAVAADIEEIAKSMRRLDAQEVLAAGCGSPRQALSDSFALSSVCLTAERDGVPVAAFGLVPECLLGGRARVWMLGTDGLAPIKKTFVKVSRLVIAFFLGKYPELYNFVDCRYVGAFRWLESCGAVFEKPVAVGAGGELFAKFIMRRA